VLRRPLFVVGAALVGAALSASSAAHADDARVEKERAERLFLRGKELMDAGKTDAACVTFEESLRHDRAGGTLLNVAECYAALQRYASAEASLREARALAEAAQRVDAVEFVDRRLADIAPRVAHLRLLFPARPREGAAFTLDGEPLATPSGDPLVISVDPGRHAIAATAPQSEGYHVDLEVEGDGALVSLVVPDLPSRASQTFSSPAVRPAPAAQRIVGWSVASVGAAALAVGAALGVSAIVLWDDVSERCPAPVCDDGEAIAQGERAGVLADGATLALGIGAASATLGLVLALTAPSQGGHGATVALVPAPNGLALQGRFQ